MRNYNKSKQYKFMVCLSCVIFDQRLSWKLRDLIFSGYHRLKGRKIQYIKFCTFCKYEIVWFWSPLTINVMSRTETFGFLFSKNQFAVRIKGLAQQSNLSMIILMFFKHFLHSVSALLFYHIFSMFLHEFFSIIWYNIIKVFSKYR